MRIFTIGGYGFTEQSFIASLMKEKIELLIDVRLRRGMRGAKYAFLNSTRLQGIISEVHIKYIHSMDLAPTISIRNIQKLEDKGEGIEKRNRSRLSSTFIHRYRSEILGNFESSRFKDAIKGINSIALFCVEGPPCACHRFLAAEHLMSELGVEEKVRHLMP